MFGGLGAGRKSAVWIQRRVNIADVRDRTMNMALEAVEMRGGYDELPLQLAYTS